LFKEIAGALMRKKYRFQYTDSGMIFMFLFTGVIITSTISYLTRNVTIMMLTLILFPIIILLLKKAPIKKAEAILYKDRLQLNMQKIKYDIDFRNVKSYKYEHIQNAKLSIMTNENRTVTISVNEKFANTKNALKFFADFNRNIQEYALKHPELSIKRAKHYLISKDMLILLIVLSITAMITILKQLGEGNMTLVKAFIMIAVLTVLWSIRAVVLKKYNQITPQQLYDHNETNAKSKRIVIVPLLVIYLYVFVNYI